MSDVLGSQFNATACGLSCPPLPANAIANAPALLLIAIVPLAFPAAVGAKITFRIAVCPGVKDVFAPAPFALNPAPVTSALEIVTFALPLFVSVTFKELLLPTTTLPKSTLAVLAVSESVFATLLPVAVMVRGDPGASLTNEIAPVAGPAPCGANTTLNVAFCPGGMPIGKAKPEVLNPAPVTVTVETVTIPVPPFCNVTVCELLEPIATLGKLALIGAAASCGCGVFVGGVGGPPLPFPAEFVPATTPAHPFAIKAVASTIATKHLDTFCVSDLWFPIVWPV
jgi:hypothetical protein